jgi:hypothetical protein
MSDHGEHDLQGEVLQIAHGFPRRRDRSGRHFRALAAAEDSTPHVHFRVTPGMPGLRYLRLTDLPSIDDISARGKSYRKGGLT